jgi:hypothetical protein
LSVYITEQLIEVFVFGSFIISVLQNPSPIPCLQADRRHPLQNKNPQDVDLTGSAIKRSGAQSTNI